jgi:transposase-like protein
MKIIEKQLIALIKKETTVTSVARNLGVSRVTIYAWLTKYSED